MGASVYETLLYEVDDQIATITLNRPERLNALNGTLLREMREATEAAAADTDVRVVILTGAGRLFSAGGDLKDGTGAATEPRGQHREPAVLRADGAAAA